MEMNLSHSHNGLQWMVSHLPPLTSNLQSQTRGKNKEKELRMPRGERWGSDLITLSLSLIYKLFLLELEQQTYSIYFNQLV